MSHIASSIIADVTSLLVSFQPEAVPARVTLGVTSLLTLSTQHANSQKSLPPVSYIKVGWNFKGAQHNMYFVIVS